MRYLGLRPNHLKHSHSTVTADSAKFDDGTNSSANPMNNTMGRIMDVETGEPARRGSGNLRVDANWKFDETTDDSAPSSTRTPPAQGKVTFQRGITHLIWLRAKS